MGIKLSVFCLNLALVLISMTSAARADEWNKETRITVNEPLELPGAVLSPGTYIFKLADSVSDRRIVQIYSEDASGPCAPKCTDRWTPSSIPFRTWRPPRKP